MTLRVHPDEIVRESPSPLLDKHDSWERARLREVADVLNGFAFKSSQFSHSEGVPLIRIRDVGSAATKIRYAGDYDLRYLVDRGTIVVGMDGDFRAARWIGPPALLNQRVCTIKVRDESLYDEAFLLYALPGYLDAIHDWTSSVTVKHLSSETIKEIPLPLPPLAEQRRIVAAIEEHLSRLNEAHASCERGTARAYVLRQAVLETTFATSWPLMAVGKVASLSDGPFGSNLKTSHYVSSGPRVVRLQNVGDGVFRDERAHITPQHFATLSKYEIIAGDIVVASLGEEAPRACLIPQWFGPAVVKADCIRVRPSAKVNGTYLMWALNSPPVKRQAAERIKGIGRPRLGLGGLRELEIPLPPLDEQLRLAFKLEEQLSLVGSLVTNLESTRTRSALLRRAVLTQAFRGELVPQDRSDEPASTLLVRIAAERAAATKPTRRRKETAPA